MGSNRRGVSEVISFVLVFSLIITSVGVVYTVGYAGLQDARNHERIDNAERAFSVLAQNVEDIRRHGVPGRATEIKLAGAQLYTGDPILVNVTGDYNAGQTDPEDFATGNVSVVPIVYESDSGTTIRYVNGAILRSGSPNTAIMVRKPPMLTHPSRTLIPILATSALRDGGVGGAMTAHVRTVRSSSNVLVGETTGTYDTVTITIHSPYASAWQQYLDAQGMVCSLSTDRTTCRIRDVERLYVVLVRIAVSIE